MFQQDKDFIILFLVRIVLLLFSFPDFLKTQFLTFRSFHWNIFVVRCHPSYKLYIYTQERKKWSTDCFHEFVLIVKNYFISILSNTHLKLMFLIAWVINLFAHPPPKIRDWSEDNRFGWIRCNESEGWHDSRI